MRDGKTISEYAEGNQGSGLSVSAQSESDGPGGVQSVAESFQSRVRPWVLECFGEQIANDSRERNHRFLEEALELVQARGCTVEEAHLLVDYVYFRPAGDPVQEIGGVMVTLAALCLAGGFDMHEAGEIELNRVWGKIEQIRAKQAAKPRNSPLPSAQQRTNPEASKPQDSLNHHPESEIPSHVSAKESRRATCFAEVGEVERLRAQQNGWIARIRELEEYAIMEGGKLRTRIAELEARLNGISAHDQFAECVKANHRIDELTASLADRDARIEQLEGENDGLRAEVGHWEASTAGWSETIDTLEAALEAVRDRAEKALHCGRRSPAPPPLPEAGEPTDTDHDWLACFEPECLKCAALELQAIAVNKKNFVHSGPPVGESNAPGSVKAVAGNCASVEGEKSAMEPRYSETNEAHLLAAGWRYVGGVNCWLDPQTQIEQTFEDAWQVQRRRDTSAQQAAPPEVPGPQQATTDEQNSPPAEPLNQEEIDRVKLMLANARAMFHNPERAAATGCEGCAEILELLARAAAAGQYQDGTWKIATSPQDAPEPPATLSPAAPPAEQGGGQRGTVRGEIEEGLV